MRVDILGLPIDCVDMPGAVERVADFVEKDNQANLVLAVNPEKVIAAREDPMLAAVLHEAELLIPDGIGVVVAARLLGGKGIRRVPGADLMPELCALAAIRGWPIYLYGASEEVNSTVAGELGKRFPRLCIAGRANGYVRSDEMQKLIDTINESGARILFVALGSPKQELWMHEYRKKLKTVRACQGVGGTFDVLAGKVERAPASWRAIHLEWLYRLIKQPSRIRRQGKLPIFVMHLVKEVIIRALKGLR